MAVSIKPTVKIPISLLDEHPLNDQIFQSSEPDDLLIGSIQIHGLLTPIMVNDTGDGRYRILSGTRRKRVYEQLGIEEIEAQVTNIKNEQQEILIIYAANIGRDFKDSYKMRLFKPLKQLVCQVRENADAEPLSGSMNNGSNILVDTTTEFGNLLEIIDNNQVTLKGKRTWEIVEMLTGLSEYQQIVLTRACDENYRERKLAELQSAVETNKSIRFKKGEIQRLREAWQQIEEAVYTGEISLLDVDKEVKKINKLIDELKNPPKPKAAKRTAPKPFEKEEEIAPKDADVNAFCLSVDDYKVQFGCLPTLNPQSIEDAAGSTLVTYLESDVVVCVRFEYLRELMSKKLKL